MKFSIEKKVSKKTGKSYVALFLNDEVINFVSLDKLFSVLYKCGITPDVIKEKSFELKINV